MFYSTAVSARRFYQQVVEYAKKKKKTQEKTLKLKSITKW